jgi:3-oxoacyl-[acyl-carrier protein] reductase
MYDLGCTAGTTSVAPDAPRILVTGSTSGIGLATAQRLLTTGATVVVTGRQRTTVSAALDALGGAERTDGVVCNLHTAEGTQILVDTLSDRFGALDAVVLSHGGPQIPEIFAKSDPKTFEALAEAMFLTNARLVHALLPLLRAGSRDGRIVLVTSEAARYPTTGEVMIGALAAANVMFIRTLARELSRDSIRANVVTVSLTHDTDTYERVMSASDFSRKLFEKAEKLMPFPVRADDVAGTIAYLLSPQAAPITGQIVAVTGGLTT